MPYTSNRRVKERIYDSHYDRNISVSSEKTSMNSSTSALSSSSSIEMYPKYGTMFKNGLQQKRVKLRQCRNESPDKRNSLQSFATVKAIRATSAGTATSHQRLVSGSELLPLPAEVISKTRLAKPRIEEESKTEECGVNVTVFEVNFDPRHDLTNQRFINCEYFQQRVDTRRIKTRATQTLYRESSAQTLPYLPEIKDKENDQFLEVFQLSNILPGDKPPGLYEVEILERARKRWSFNKALKESMKRQFQEALAQARHAKYKTILEAFEWERWIEREEYIQECQMMRLEIVIRMFDKREREIHAASKTRIEMCYEQIEARRQAALAKNEREFNRALRQLNAKRMNQPRVWRKENIIRELGCPGSEFYAPYTRYGVNPSRRHFSGTRKAFESRIDDLEKRALNFQRIECPFAKLKEWAKPKERLNEVEQNFCSDGNLQKLYEQLKGLRTQAIKQKVVPKCLNARTKLTVDDISVSSLGKEIDEPAVADRETPVEETPFEIIKQDVLARLTMPLNRTTELLIEKRQEELENMLASYEGTTIGWIMQFLTEEMERLREQRKLHFFTILAQKERWRREAAEAGLRQKENEMREIYEEIYQLCNVVNNEITDDYLQNILTEDLCQNSNIDAGISVKKLARVIDTDIQRWLETFTHIQTPLTYESLRKMLRKLIFPDANEMLLQHESHLIARYIIDDVIFARLDEELESYDIVSDISSRFVNRLLDTDMLDFSTESSEESDEHTNATAQREANAIVRKLIRRVVPGRRWRTSTERMADNNVADILDGIFKRVEKRGSTITSHNVRYTGCFDLHPSPSGFDLPDARIKINNMNRQSEYDNESHIIHTDRLGFEMPSKHVTRDLRKEETLIDYDVPIEDNEIIGVTPYGYRKSSVIEMSEKSLLRPVPSDRDIPKNQNLFYEPMFFESQELEADQESGTSTADDLSHYGIIVRSGEASQVSSRHIMTQTTARDLVIGMLKGLIPTEDGDSEDKSDVEVIPALLSAIEPFEFEPTPTGSVVQDLKQIRSEMTPGFQSETRTVKKRSSSHDEETLLTDVEYHPLQTADDLSAPAPTEMEKQSAMDVAEPSGTVSSKAPPETTVQTAPLEQDAEPTKEVASEHQIAPAEEVAADLEGAPAEEATVETQAASAVEGEATLEIPPVEVTTTEVSEAQAEVQATLGADGAESAVDTVGGEQVNAPVEVDEPTQEIIQQTELEPEANVDEKPAGAEKEQPTEQVEEGQAPKEEELVEEVTESPTTVQPVEAEEAPATEIPAEEIPAEEAPAEEAQGAKAQAEEALEAETPAKEVPADTIPAEEGTAEETPAQDVPVEEIPAENIPAEEAPAEKAQAAEAQAGEILAEEAPAEEVAAEVGTAEETPAQETTAGEVPPEETKTEEVPAEDVPVEQAPLEEA